MEILKEKTSSINVYFDVNVVSYIQLTGQLILVNC